MRAGKRKDANSDFFDHADHHPNKTWPSADVEASIIIST